MIESYLQLAFIINILCCWFLESLQELTETAGTLLRLNYMEFK